MQELVCVWWWEAVLLFLICKRTPDSWITPFRLETKVWRWCMKTPRWSCNGSAVQVGQVKHSARKLLIVKMSCLILYGNLKVSLLWFVKSFFLICEVLNTPNISSHRGKVITYFLFVCFYFVTGHIIKKEVVLFHNIVDPWTIHVWIVGVHLYMDFFFSKE